MQHLTQTKTLTFSGERVDYFLFVDGVSISDEESFTLHRFISAVTLTEISRLNIFNC